jgi:hypothetical protein
MEIVGHPHRTDPELLRKVTSRSQSQVVKGVRIRLRGYNSLAAQVALLKTAYTYAFRVFGYGVIANPPMRAIREQLLKPDFRLIQGTWAINWSAPNEIVGINAVQEPGWLQSWLAIFDLQSAHASHRVGVFLPKHDDFDLRIYQQLSALFGAPMPVELKHIEETSNLIQEPDLCSYSRTLWF